MANIKDKYLIVYYLLSIIRCLEPLNSFTLKDTQNDELIEIIDPDLLPQKDDKDIYYLAILHTTDIHGSFYEKTVQLPSGNIYSIGGLEYFGKYVNILRKQWGEQFLYFDSGDHFQGGLESSLSKGKVILDTFNKLKVQKSAMGNHEFDYGNDFLYDYMNNSNFEWLVANIKNKTTNSYYTFPKQNRTSIIEMENGIKIGLIGLSTIETPSTTEGDVKDLEFEYYADIVIKESENLRNQGANAVVVLGHLGLTCKNDANDVKYNYTLRDKNTIQKECGQNDEATILLKKLPPGTIDLFLGGHKHDVAHHWINGFPVVSSDINGKYAALVYLPFDRKTKKILNEKIVMEGPLPICGKIFSKNHRCDVVVLNDEEEKFYGKIINFKFHGVEMSKDESLKIISETYKDAFDKYAKDILTFTNEHFEVTKEHENALGNFYTDFLRQITGAEISVIGPGNLRAPFYRGNITNATIHGFAPFNNNPVRFKAYGKEIKKIMTQIQEGSYGFYPVSGLQLTVKAKPKKKLISVMRYDGKKVTELEDDRLYTMASIAFNFPVNPEKKGGDDFAKVSLWFKPKDIEAVKINGEEITREILINYLRKIDELKANKYYDVNHPRMRIID